MAKKKFYAVKNGHNPGIYLTWPECQEQTKGFPNAKFKGFATLKEAETYLKETKIKEVATPAELKQAVEHDYKGVRVFCDGSWNKKTSTYGIGVYFMDDEGKEILSISDSGSDPLYIESANIAGECVAAMTAIEKAQELGYDEITIIHDYEGIAKWVVDSLDQWEVGKAVSAVYKATYDEAIAKGMKIHFIWVRGHIGVEGNEIVDVLAKKGCGIL